MTLKTRLELIARQQEAMLDMLERLKMSIPQGIAKQCPYCGGHPIICEKFVFCGDCKMYGPTCLGRHEAIIKWNNIEYNS